VHTLRGGRPVYERTTHTQGRLYVRCVSVTTHDVIHISWVKSTNNYNTGLVPLTGVNLGKLFIKLSDHLRGKKSLKSQKFSLNENRLTMQRLRILWLYTRRWMRGNPISPGSRWNNIWPTFCKEGNVLINFISTVDVNYTELPRKLLGKVWGVASLYAV